MTKTLIIGTTNPAKVSQLRDVLEPLGFEVRALEKGSVSAVEEDGTTAQENARKKATAYAAALGEPVLSMDNALFFDGLEPEKQPGLHVRRIGGSFAATDEELLAHGVELIKTLGGKATGYWEYGICIARPDGQVAEVIIRTPRIFTSVPSEQVVAGYPLESIQIDPESGKYISEMTKEEQADFWRRTLGAKVSEFVRETLVG